jgi:prolyl oligopeptidase
VARGRQRSHKPNTWRDFIACAEYLTDHKYTSPARLASQGGSAGGILVGRALTERPHLFGAVIDQVGWSDMLRTENTSNGAANIPEFGSVKAEEGFNSLFAMSTYHHVEGGSAYPAVLLETGINDSRVDPWQMTKMTARLQAATTSAKPVLLRVEYQGGHVTMGGTREQEEEALADEWVFLLWQFGVPEFQPPKP